MEPLGLAESKACYRASLGPRNTSEGSEGFLPGLIPKARKPFAPDAELNDNLQALRTILWGLLSGMGPDGAGNTFNNHLKKPKILNMMLMILVGTLNPGFVYHGLGGHSCA